MVRHALVVALFLPAFAFAQAPSALEIVNWDFAAGALDGWQCKSNVTMEIDEAPDRGHFLAGSISYDEFDFGWFTRFHEESDYSNVWAVEFDVRGDGQGGTLHVQLGLRGESGSIYYANRRDSIELDFTGWRTQTMPMMGFSTPTGRPRYEDLQQIYFFQFTMSGRTTGTTDIAFDNIRLVGATDAQQRQLDSMKDLEQLLHSPAALDGTNILPNSGFEADPFDAGTPALWSANDWGTGSVLAHVSNIRHEGDFSVAVTCANDQQRGCWHLRRPLSAGPWIFRAWYRTEEMEYAPNRGANARLITLGEDNRGLATTHVYAKPGENGWRQMELNFDAPAGTAMILVELFNSFNTGTVYWDDVYLWADVAAIAERKRLHEENLAALEEIKTMLPEAENAVAALRERAEETSDWLLLLTTLQWALDDARLAREADLGISARDTCQDILDYCRRADEIISRAAQAQNPPPLSPDLDANPYYERLNAEAANLAKSCPEYKKGEDGYNQIANAWSFRTLGAESAVMAWGLLHPRSAEYGNPDLLRRLLVHIQAITQNHVGGDFNPGREAIYGRDPNINRFCIAPLMDALLWLEKRYPWVILPSKREEWRRELRTLVDYQYETYGPRQGFDPKRPPYYPNMDVHHLIIMEFAHRLFGDEKYAEDRDTMLQWLNDALFPNGAWTYHWPQNECYVYHQLNVTFIARYYELTGDVRAREILRKSAGYYPLVHDSEGMTEHYTDCSWKHMWGAASPAGADVIAGMFDCRENKRAALDAARRGYPGSLGSLYSAAWWKNIEPAAPRPDWLIFDDDIVGPRGQFGTFSFAGTARYFPRGAIGKDTFVGCMISNRDEGPLPLDAALQIATIEARLNPEGNHWHNARYVSGDERASVIVTPDLATLAVRYRITRPRWGFGSTDTSWEGLQQWLLCGERLIGMVTIRAVEDTSCAGIWGRLRFGMHKEFEEGEEGMFKYGSLVTRLHDHNFAAIETAPSETFYLDTPDRFRSRQILLKDDRSVSGLQPPYSYSAGREFYYLAEVLPYWSDLADGVLRIARRDIKGFELVQGDRRLVVLHNETDDTATYRLHAQGDEVQVYSPQNTVATVPLTGGRAVLEIPAQSHVLVVAQP